MKTAGYQDFYSWARRRRFMYMVALFCMGVIGYVLGAGRDGAVADTAVTMSFFTLIGITGSYVFGAVWQDVSHMASLSKSTSASVEQVIPAQPVKVGD